MLKRFVGLACVTAALCVAPAAYSAAAELPVVNVGATPTAVPFNFLNPQTNALEGVMIEVANAVGKEAHFKVNMMSIPFSSLVPALQTGKIDVISSAFSKSAEREKVVDFTDTVFQYGEGLVVPESDKTDYKSMDELKGKTIGVQIGVVYVKPLESAVGEDHVKMYDSMNDMINDVRLGRIEVAMGDGPTMAYIAKQQTGKGVRLVSGYKSSIATTVGLAVRKGDTARRDQINQALAKLREQGTIDAILKKWNIIQ